MTTHVIIETEKLDALITAVERLQQRVECLVDTREEDTVTAAEAAKIMGKSPATISRMVQRGELTPLPGGGNRRFRRGDLT